MNIDGINLTEKAKTILLNFQDDKNSYLQEQIIILHGVIKLMARYADTYEPEDQTRTLSYISQLYNLEDDLLDLKAEEGGES
jgi:hypothetical protein